MTFKICRWDGGVCRRVSCGVVLASGEVAVCWRHGNPSGRSFRRKGASNG
jgi:hypothetical protein